MFFFPVGYILLFVTVIQLCTVKSKVWFLRCVGSAKAAQMALLVEKGCRGLAYLAITTGDTHATR